MGQIPLSLHLHNCCWLPCINSIPTLVLPVILPAITQSAFFQDSKSAKRREDWQWICELTYVFKCFFFFFFFVEFRSGLCFWENHFENKILLPTWPGELLNLELFSVASLIPLKYSDFKDAGSYFQMEFGGTRVFCECLNKDEDTFKKENW